MPQKPWWDTLKKPVRHPNESNWTARIYSWLESRWYNYRGLFQQWYLADVTAVSKGKGFQGVVKGIILEESVTAHMDSMTGAGTRFNWASSWPSRVFKGMRMAGRLGGKKAKVLNLKVVRIIPENNILLLKGSVPGAKGSYVIIESPTGYNLMVYGNYSIQ